MAHEALAQVQALAGAAAAAVPAVGGAGGRRGARRGEGGLLGAGAGGCACRQWSSRHCGLGTLMRHAMSGVARHGRSAGTAPAPLLRAQGVRHAPAPRALVASGGLALRLRAGLAAARAAAVAVAAVAAAAQHHLRSAAHAQVQPGGSVHGHPGTAEVLDGLVPARHTAVAPPSLARCGARYGRRACRQVRPLPRPPSSALPALYRHTPARRAPLHRTGAGCLPPSERPSLPGRPAGRPGRLNLCTAKPRSPSPAGPAYWKTASSPANSVGS